MGDACTPFPGVTKRRDWLLGDAYRGTAEALVSAGLVTLDELPGQPGRGRTMVTLNADGTAVKKGAGSPGCQWDEGRKQIRKSGEWNFEVCIQVSPEERERRKERSTVATYRPEISQQPLMRPLARRGHLCLVWSAPA